MTGIRNTQGPVYKGYFNKDFEWKNMGLSYSAGMDRKPVYSGSGLIRFDCNEFIYLSGTIDKAFSK